MVQFKRNWITRTDTAYPIGPSHDLHLEMVRPDNLEKRHPRLGTLMGLHLPTRNAPVKRRMDITSLCIKPRHAFGRRAFGIFLRRHLGLDSADGIAFRQLSRIVGAQTCNLEFRRGLT